MPIDLTPFGFTPTETVVYGRLLALGPSSGYGIAKDVGLARANAYAALDGLVTKGAAQVDEGAPKLYRPVTPGALLVRIAARESAKLDLLEQQVSAERRAGAPSTVSVSGDRDFSQMALRSAARHSGHVVFMGTADLLSALLPVWRKREADGSPTSLYATEAVDPSFPFPLAGKVGTEEARRLFGNYLSVVLVPDAAIVGLGTGAELAGFWTTDGLLLGLLRAAVELLTGNPGPN